MPAAAEIAELLRGLDCGNDTHLTWSRDATLALVRDTMAPFSRQQFAPGHLTASAIVLSPGRDAVLAAAERLDYRYHTLAAELRRRTSRTVAIQLPSLHVPILATKVAALEQRLRAAGLHPLLCHTLDQETEQRFYEECRGRRVCGVVVTAEAVVSHSQPACRARVVVDTSGFQVRFLGLCIFFQREVRSAELDVAPRKARLDRHCALERGDGSLVFAGAVKTRARAVKERSGDRGHLDNYEHHERGKDEPANSFTCCHIDLSNFKDWFL